MNRRLSVALFAASAALIALAWLLAWATRGGEPLSAPASAPLDAATPARGDAAPGGAEPSLPAPPEPEPRALPAAAGRVRVVVDETAARLSPVTVRLQREGDARSSSAVIVGAEHTWTDLPPGRWHVVLAGTGWAATPDHVDLPGGEVQVDVRPRNRVEGLLVAGRSGRPVPHAKLTVEAWKPMQPGDTYLISIELGSAELDTPGGRFALAGADLPLGGTDISYLKVRAEAAGLLEGHSDSLDLDPTPFWSGVVVVLPEAVLIGHVIGLDPRAGRVPLPGARVLLVDPSAELSQAVVSGGLVQFLAPAAEPLAETDSGADGAFAFGPLPGAAIVQSARLLVRADGWLPSLSDPIEIDQRAAAREVDLVLSPGGRLHGLLRVPLGPAGSGERAPIAQPEIVNLGPTPETPAGAPRHFVCVPRRVPAPADEPDTARFEFDIAGLPPGRWQVLAALRPADAVPGTELGVHTLVAEVDIVDGQRTDVALALDPHPAGATVSGTARLPEGLVLDEADVGLFAAPANGRLAPPVSTAPLAPDGSFTLRGVPPGDWTLVIFASSADRSELAVGSGFVRIGAGSPAPLHLDLARPEVRVASGPATRTRRLRLAGSCGDAVLDVLVALGRVSVQPDADGGAHVFGLLPARWTLRADGDPPTSVDFELPPGAELVQVELP